MTCECPEQATFKCDRCKQEFCVECMEFNVLNTKRDLCVTCNEHKHLKLDWAESEIVRLLMELRECNRIITQLRKGQG